MISERVLTKSGVVLPKGTDAIDIRPVIPTKDGEIGRPDRERWRRRSARRSWKRTQGRPVFTGMPVGVVPPCLLKVLASMITRTLFVRIELPQTTPTEHVETAAM